MADLAAQPITRERAGSGHRRNVDPQPRPFCAIVSPKTWLGGIGQQVELEHVVDKPGA
jgi:hypothetical protein